MAGSDTTALNWRRTAGLAPVFWVVIAFLYLPIAILVVYSFNASRVVTVWSGLSLHWFEVVLQNPDLQRSALNSVAVALTATVIATLTALSAAIALHAAIPGRLAGPIIAIINLPLVVPEIVISITTLVLFASLHFDHGLWNLIIGHTVFCIPYAFLPIRARLAGFDRSLEDAARDLYANSWQLFRQVTLPLLMPAVTSGFVLAFVTSLDDFLISMMVGKAGLTTLPVYVYGMMRIGLSPEVNAISTLIILAPVLLFVLIILPAIRHLSRTGASSFTATRNFGQ